MAATLTADGELTYFSFPIEKSEETADGDLIVYGKATDGTVDSDLQIVDQNWSAKAIQEWLDTGGNVRVQHQARRDPAGRGLAVECTSDGHYVKALVVEPVAKELVRKRVLQDFSVGITLPDINPDPTGKAMNGIITGRRDGRTKISEISLVDRGSNFNSKFQLVKAAGDAGEPEFVGKMLATVNVEVNGGALSENELAAVAMDRLLADRPTATVTVDTVTKAADGGFSLTDLPHDASISFKPSDLAKLLAHKATAVEAEKRRVDPNVGGGVDRDKVPGKDFAGRNRSFPIVTPGDVSDAASSIGRAGGGNYSSDKLKKRIISIARRKGSAFVAELPEAWKKELGMSESAKAAEPEVVEEVPVDAAKVNAAEPVTEPEPETVKAEEVGDVAKGDGGEPTTTATDSGSAGGGDDGGDENDEDAAKAADPAVVEPVEKVVAVEKKSKVMCTGCGANVHAKHSFCPECGDSLKGAPSIGKNHDFTCLKCGNQLDKGEKFCPACGKRHPGYLPEADSKVKGATPTAGTEEAPAAVAVPAHREPDGPAIEEFEKDSNLTDGDEGQKAAAAYVPGDPEASAAMRLKVLNVPLDYGTLHDLTCPCYHPDDVAKSYPRVDLSTLDVAHWQNRAFDLAASAPLEQAMKANELWQHVAVIRDTDPRSLSEARSDLFKSFLDANPGVGSFPSPGSISPGQFNHPLAIAGHEAPSPGHAGPNTSPASFGQISAAQFSQGYLSAGRASASPSDQQGMMQPMSVPATTGVPTRTYYTNAMRSNARQAMSAMHDHIASTFPDLCPAYTTAGPYNGENLPGSRPVPAGVGGPVPHGAAKVKKAKGGKGKRYPVGVENPQLLNPEVDKGATLNPAPAGVPAPVEKAAVLDSAAVQEMITKAVATVNETRDAEVAGLRRELKKTRKRLNALAEQPDPNGPYRGVAFDQIVKTVAAPEVLPSVGRAERAQEFLFQALHNQWRNDPDPMQREVAWRELTKMTRIDGGTDR